MSLRDKTARWIFDARWSRMPDDEVAVHINNTILDAAIEAAMKNKSTDNERMWKEKYDYKRGYLQAINDLVGDIKALKEGK